MVLLPGSGSGFKGLLIHLTATIDRWKADQADVPDAVQYLKASLAFMMRSYVHDSSKSRILFMQPTHS